MSVSLPSVDEVAADPAALVGRVLADRYQVTGLLGTGGIGRVYRAQHRVLGREVALKVLLEQYQTVPDLQRRFEREAMALAALSHPNIVTVVDFLATKELTFLVMELVEGDDLETFLGRERPTPDEAFQLMAQLLSSLAYAHSRDVVHRDLKPQNVKVQRLAEGRLHVVILDFGLAKFMDGSGPGADLTRSGLIVGTPAYMAPEQASGARADQRADVYAAAVLFFEMLTGRHPFDAQEGADMVRHHLLTPAPTVGERAPGARVHPDIEAFFARSLAKDASARFEDGASMLRALNRLTPDGYVPPPGEEVQRSRAAAVTELAPAAPAAGGRPSWARRLGLAAAALVLLVAAGATGFWAGRGQPAGAVAAATSGPTRVPLEDDGPPEPTGAVALTAVETGEDSALEPPVAADTASGDTAEGEEDEGDDDGSAASDEPGEVANAEGSADDDEATGEDAGETGGDGEGAEDEDPNGLPDTEEAAALRAAHPAENPWRESAGPLLTFLRGRQDNGQPLNDAHIRQLRRYVRRHPDDPRGRLILAREYLDRGRSGQALANYRRAWQEDPSVRGDPLMRADLMRLAASPQAHEEATALIVAAYGGEATRLVRRWIRRERSDRQRRARLMALLRALQRQ